MKRNYLFLHFAACFLFMGLIFGSRSVSAKKVTGECGAKAKYSYDSQTQTLVISGKGAITDRIYLSAPRKENPDNISEYEKNRERYTLKKIIIKEGITAIKTKEGKFAACDIERVTKIQLPNTLKTIAGDSFWDFSFAYMKGRLFIPKGVKNIDAAAFYCSETNNGLKKITVSKKNPYFIAKQGVLFSKNRKKLLLYPREKKNKKYKLPSSVKEIGDIAFARNEHIQEVVLPKKLNLLGAGAFCGCRSLSKINLTKQTKIKKISDYKGVDCADPAGGISGLYYQSGENNSSDTFKNYDGKGVFYLGTFEGTALKSAVIPNSVKYVASDTFKPFWNHQKLKFENPLETLYIGKNYMGNINKNRKSGSQGAVYEGQKSLMLCWTPLKSVTVSSGNQKYKIKNHALYSKNGKKLYQVFVTPKLPKEYEIDAKTTEIATRAFGFINTIEKVHVKGSLKSIGADAFNRRYYGAKPGDSYNISGYLEHTAPADALTGITIDGNVDTIRDSAFQECTSLTEFQCKGSIKYIGERAFWSCSKLSRFSCQGRIDTIKGTAFDYCPEMKPFSDNRPWDQS